MKQSPERTLSRTTLWRRRRLLHSYGLKKKTGRSLINFELEEERLLLAAAVVQLGINRGIRGFGEHEISHYPRTKTGRIPARPGLSGAKIPYPAKLETLQALRASRLPASLLLIQAVYKCKPAPIDAAKEDTGAKYARRLVPTSRTGDTRSAYLTRLAIQTIYQRHLSRGFLPDNALWPVVTKLFDQVGLDKHMRHYWRNHRQRWKARDLLDTLVTSTARHRAEGTFLRKAGMTLTSLDPDFHQKSEMKLTIANGVIHLDGKLSPVTVDEAVRRMHKIVSPSEKPTLAEYQAAFLAADGIFIDHPPILRRAQEDDLESEANKFPALKRIED